MYFLACLAPLMAAQAASFDCAKADNQAEKLVCTNTELSKLDEQLAAVYMQKITTSINKAELKLSQRRWLIERRNSCVDVLCIKNAYEARLLEIKQRKDELSTLTASSLVTGTWERETSPGTLHTMQVGDSVHFELELFSDAPAYNVGFVEGKFELHGNRGTFISTEYEKCKITFTFYHTNVVLDSISYNDCGFGHAVYAIGKFYLRSTDEPVFSGDPR